MKNLEKFCASGILEAYVLGSLTNKDKKQVEEMAIANAEISVKIYEIESLLEEYAHSQAVTPHPTIKPILLETINYIER